MLVGPRANWRSLREPILMKNTTGICTCPPFSRSNLAFQIFLGATRQGPPDHMQDNPERDQATQRTALRLPPEDSPGHPQRNHGRTDPVWTSLRQAQQNSAGIPETAPPSRNEAGCRTPTWGAERRRVRRGCRSPPPTSCHQTPAEPAHPTEQDNNRKGSTAASKGPTSEPFFVHSFHARPAVPAHPTSPKHGCSMEAPRDHHPRNITRPATEKGDTRRGGTVPCHLHESAQEKLHHLPASGHCVSLQRIPSHKGIPANEMADALRKQATTMTLVHKAPPTQSG
ncbi:uncharacterized protein LOC135372823 [Ornithodoros turicata]|uniref:uncharacterized protein LOC135372823 n=1 Tax=Ornithodoros turicata TaxID=34597 RepID=UPI00313909A6